MIWFKAIKALTRWRGGWRRRGEDLLKRSSGRCDNGLDGLP